MLHAAMRERAGAIRHAKMRQRVAIIVERLRVACRALRETLTACCAMRG